MIKQVTNSTDSFNRFIQQQTLVWNKNFHFQKLVMEKWSLCWWHCVFQSGRQLWTYSWMKIARTQRTRLCASPSLPGTVGRIHCQPSAPVTHLSLHPFCCQGAGRLCVNITLLFSLWEPAAGSRALQVHHNLCCKYLNIIRTDDQPTEDKISRCLFLPTTPRTESRQQGLQSRWEKSSQLINSTKWRRGVLKGYSLGSLSLC